jgi:hypothetical protein
MHKIWCLLASHRDVNRHQFMIPHKELNFDIKFDDIYINLNPYVFK